MNKDLEEIKAKIEYAKTQTEQLKLLVFIILTVGTGLFSLIFLIYGKGEFLLKILLATGIALLTPFLFRAYIFSKSLIKLQKEIEKELNNE